ncbi:hypothetical protein [[Clostridium] fimetarium]|uniref:Choice-of-anchor A domain-containing protein n=1 Tax=[Clostridium] fimetarium TaxID=99656 RepID=A0A1I0MXL5_9FIRM|nr:hypothetical protein [[Clostridium] fimetarium]SEV93229.1 hypothetical protein SAMN05421659_102213 [[Clostridium] fimetarium]
MKNKNIIKIIKKYSKATVSVVMVFVLTVSAATLSIMASGSANADVQIELKALLGEAKSYGVFADSALIAGDFESNIATNNLKVDGTKDIGNTVGTKTNVAGTSFLKNFESGILQLRSADNIVVGSQFTKTGNIVTFGSGNGVISTANAQNVKFYVNPNYVNISNTLSTIAANFSQYTSTSDNTKGSVVNLSDMNNGIIDISKCTDMICSINITMAAYNKLQTGQLKITKNNDQIVIINISGDYSGFALSRFTVNGVASSNDNDIIADTVIFNFSDYSGSLSLSEVCGIVVATKANVTITGTSRGRVIAKTFTNPGGEWHFLAKDLEIETETDPSTQAPTQQPTTQPVTQQPTTQPVTQQPTTQPVTQQPTTQPVTQQPTTQPVTQQPTTQPVTQQPTTQPVTQQPTTQPVTQQPTTQPVTQQPTTQPETQQPTTQPETQQPTTQPETQQPTTQPVTQQPTTQPTTQQPTTQPATQQSTTQSVTQQPTTQPVTQPTTKAGEVFADEDNVTKATVTATKAPEVYADEDKVQTGDKNSISIYMIAVGVSALIILGFVIIEKTKKDKKRKEDQSNIK